MYEIRDVDTKVVDRPFGYSVQVYARDGLDWARLWVSGARLTRKDAEGFEADIEAALCDIRCTWCNTPATRIDHIGNLDLDVSDIVGFCDDPVCVREAKRELELT